MTASPNSAARLPSMTRWSNVTETFPIRRTTTSPSRTTGRSVDPVDAEDRHLGVVDQRRDEQSGRLAGARDGERAAAQLLRLERPRRARPRRAAAPRRRARRARACRRRGRPGRRGPARSGRRRRCRSGRAARARRSSTRAFSSGNSCSDSATAWRTSGTSRFRSTSEKSHSSTQVTAGISRCARVRCSNIWRLTPCSGTRVPSDLSRCQSPDTSGRRRRGRPPP